MTTDIKKFQELENKLHENIKAAHEAAAKPLQSEEITLIVRQVVTSLSGDVTAADLKLYAELQELAGYIQHAKAEIAAIQPKEISTSHIPRATDELDAVVGATEEATNKIMDVCDEISAISGDCEASISEKLVNCTTKIFEACNFQDITGQRITKVVQTLKYIDGKIEALLKVLGDEINRGSDGSRPLPSKPVDPDSALLNGPQLKNNGIDQSAIDRMMSDN